MKKKPQRNSSSRASARNSGASSGVIRIIGGEYRSRKLPVLDAPGLRPTSDRVRETLFNWLQFDVAGARCLDCFAGSGALGFEALSRGAQAVTFLELSAANAAQLTRNLTTLGTTAEVVQTDALAWLTQPADQPYDVVFIDPPFHQALVEPTLQRLFQHGYVGQHTRLYLEQERALAWPTLPTGWQCHRDKQTAEVRYGLFIQQAD